LIWPGDVRGASFGLAYLGSRQALYFSSLIVCGLHWLFFGDMSDLYRAWAAGNSGMHTTHRREPRSPRVAGAGHARARRDETQRGQGALLQLCHHEWQALGTRTGEARRETAGAGRTGAVMPHRVLVLPASDRRSSTGWQTAHGGGQCVSGRASRTGARAGAAFGRARTIFDRNRAARTRQL